jgi:ParB-like chromosome segregation protein Spo0J
MSRKHRGRNALDSQVGRIPAERTTPGVAVKSDPKSPKGVYLLLEGHSRLKALRRLGLSPRIRCRIVDQEKGTEA